MSNGNDKALPTKDMMGQPDLQNIADTVVRNYALKGAVVAAVDHQGQMACSIRGMTGMEISLAVGLIVKALVQAMEKPKQGSILLPM